MAHLLLSRKNTRQPRGQVRINYGHPLSHRLVAGMSPAHNIFLGMAQGQPLAKNAATQAAWKLSTLKDVVLGGRSDAGSQSITLQNHTKNIAVNDNVTLLTMGVTGTHVTAGAALANLAQNANASSFAIEHGDGVTAGVLRFRAYLGGATRYIGSTQVSTTDLFIAVARQINGIEQSLWVNGIKDPSTGAFSGNAVGFGWYGGLSMGANAKLALSLAWNRALSDSEIMAICDNPWLVFEPASRRVWFIPSVTIHALSGNNSTQTNLSAVGNIGQSHSLAGDSVTQPATSTAGAAEQTHVLGGDNAGQSQQSNGGNISQSHVLTGDSVTQAAGSTSGAIAQSHVLTGDDAVHSNQSSSGAAAQSHLLAGDDAIQVNSSSASGVGLHHLLTGADTAQPNASQSGEIILPGLAIEYRFVSGQAVALTLLATAEALAGFALATQAQPITQLHTEACYVS